MRYGVPGGNLYEDVKNVTSSDNMFTQIVGVAKDKLKNFVNLYSRAIKQVGKLKIQYKEKEVKELIINNDFVEITFDMITQRTKLLNRIDCI